MGKVQRDKQLKTVIQDLNTAKDEIKTDNNDWFEKVNALLQQLEDVLAERKASLHLNSDEIVHSVLPGIKETHLVTIVNTLQDVHAEVTDEIEGCKNDSRREKIEDHYKGLEDVMERLGAEHEEQSIESLIETIDNCIETLLRMASPYSK
ncbi:MAG: hypothetical protein UHX00_05730 [Caryophanon sp.]|nr:hypothetical protein [Caryophanon sp.]